MKNETRNLETLQDMIRQDSTESFTKAEWDIVARAEAGSGKALAEALAEQKAAIEKWERTQTMKGRTMKIYQYNQRIQFWYDRSVRVWYCQQNDINGRLVDRRDEWNQHIPAGSSNTKKQILADCRDLEEELKQGK